ncbi:TIGR02117 family protein [Cloacibacterium sp.]|uniref:TIGR02117 family protein n=1 Tax=Cloacibacterium sp. TaxID=1913682 RepID=UPI0039E642D3
MTLNKIFFFLLKSLAVLVGLVLVYALCGYFIPFIEVPAKKTDEPKVIEAFILTNGVHTDLVVPVKNDVTDWGKELPFDNTISKRYDFSYVSFGWGDKGFYLDTPSWAELQPSTAFVAAFGLGESAMHCTYYFEMEEGEDCKKIMLTKKQYEDLVNYIKDKFDRDRNGKVIFIETDSVYGINDAFYEAKGRYSFLETCNTWANNGLKVAGQKAAYWTPTDVGIFQHYR